MRILTLAFLSVASLFPAPGWAQGPPAAASNLPAQLEQTYLQWRKAVMARDIGTWRAVTASDRQIAVRNQIHSERRPFPGAVFDLPFPPPGLQGLTRVRSEARGAVAKAVYFGKVDFGVEGRPTENLLVLNFVKEGRWRYDGAEYVNLSALPDVRKQLASGNLSYVQGDDFAPQPKPRTIRPELKGPVKYIAKTYIYAPGRDVEVYVNRLSKHRVRNAKESEVIIGGARDGRNEVQFAIRSLPGSTGKEPLAARVYLMSQVPGVQPVKVWEIQVEENKPVPKATGTEFFMVTPEVVRKLQGR